MSGVSNFRKVAQAAVLISLFGVVVNLPIPEIPLSLLVNIGCLTYLYRRAELSVANNERGFDPVVAAEAMVAFGVFCLVSGLSAVLILTTFGKINGAALAAGNFSSFMPFVEGLFTAGIAPIFAMLLRIRVAELEEDIDTTGDLSSLARATSDLTNQMKAASAAVESLQKGAGLAGAATVGLAGSMKSEADKWGLALQEGQAHVKTFGEATRSGSGDVTALATATLQLKEASQDVSSLLEELSRLIASVERFVEPRTKAK